MVSKHTNTISSGSLSSVKKILTQSTFLRHRIRLLVIISLIIATIWFVPPVWKLLLGPIKVTRWTKKDGQIEAVVGPGEKGWVKLNKISKHAIYAVIAAEDGKFFSHSGFDFESIKKAYETNKKRGKYVRGGSTISQQTVKMAFLGREKTLIRKAREAIGTLLIELILSKNEIMEWYLNLAEFGDGIYGIHNGAQYYFRTRPELLTIAQAIQLAMVLPSPNAWSRGLRNHRLSDFGQRRFAAIANNMRTSGHISLVQWDTTMRSGDFGRPIAGYQAMVAAEKRGEMLCPGDPNCPTSDESIDESTLDEPSSSESMSELEFNELQETIDTNGISRPQIQTSTSSGNTIDQAPAAANSQTSKQTLDPMEPEVGSTQSLDGTRGMTPPTSDASLFSEPNQMESDKELDRKEAPSDF